MFHSHSHPPEVLVVGAGPVGMVSALILAKQGIQVRIIDKAAGIENHSFALALHTDSIELMDSLGLKELILKHACRIESIGIYDSYHRMMEIDLNKVSKKCPYIVSIGQNVLEHILVNALHDEGVSVCWNQSLSHIEEKSECVIASIDILEQRMMGYAVARLDMVVGKQESLDVRFIIGADGKNSLVRQRLKLDFPEVGKAQDFVMFEINSDITLSKEMRIVLCEETVNCLWPLSDRDWRWTFEVNDDNRNKNDKAITFPDIHALNKLIETRAPWFYEKVSELQWTAAARFEKRLASSHGHGRVWLAGDAAHITNPIGVQGMNIGLREAKVLTECIAAILSQKQKLEHLETYNRTFQEEWTELFMLEQRFDTIEDRNHWTNRYRNLFPSCIPASSQELFDISSMMGLHKDLHSSRFR